MPFNNTNAREEYFCENVHPIFFKHVIYSITDTKGTILNVSQAYCEETGYSKEEFIGKSHSFLKSENFPNNIYDELWETITKDQTWYGQIKNIKKNGEYFWADSVVEPIFKNKIKVGYISVRTNITKEKKHNSFLKELSNILDV